MQNVCNPIWLYMPVSDIIDLNDRRQGTATETGYFLNRENAILIRILIFSDAQLTAKRIINQFSALNVTGSTRADMN